MQGSASLFDEGRFGPVYRSHDPDSNQPVLIRTFAQPLTPAEQGRLVEALTRLCETPLDHPSIARPLVAGIEEGRPFLVHTLLPGLSLQRYVDSHGAQPFADVVLRVTQLAAAIDFAAAAGVHHGDLGPRDVILDADTTGISGFGVMQALHEAGIGDRGIPTRADDVRALGRIAFELITGRALHDRKDLRNLRVPGANGVRLRDALSGALGEGPDAHPTTALAFAAALQAALAESMPQPDPSRAAAAAAEPVLRDAPAVPISDLPLRPEHQSLAGAGDVEPTLALRPERDAPDPAPRLRERGPASAPDPAIRPAYPATLGIGAAHSSAREERAGGGWFLIAAALAIGILAGFTGGFVVGQRSDVPIPRFAADLLDGRLGSSRQTPAQPSPDPARGTRGADSDTDAPAPGIGPVQGVPDTGATVIQRPEISSRELGPDGSAQTPDGASPEATPRASGASPASEPRTDSPAAAGVTAPPSPADAEGTNDRPQGERPVTRIPPTTPGGLQILSRPEGARVFVDGALVGRTPLVIPSVTPGPHDVRLELDGHRDWGTLVRVQPGERARVAASLEQ